MQQAFAADLKNDVYLPVLSTLGTRAKQFNLYAQDEWKLRRNLTMTYGVRWELNLPPRDASGHTSVPDRAVDGSQGLVTYVPANSWYRRSNATAFAPRLSFAWTPKGEKTVIRAGYGIAFDTISTFQVNAIGGKVPGSVLQCRVDIPSSAGPCTQIPDLRLTQLLNTLQPFTLGIPAARPSTQLGPPNRPFGVAPDVGAFDPNLKLPTVHEWSLTLQGELPRGFVAQIGYIAKRGTRLRGYDLNQIRTDQPGFLESFLIAQRNLALGCSADGTGGCVGGQTPTLLLQLVPASFLNSSLTRSDLRRNGLVTWRSALIGPISFPGGPGLSAAAALREIKPKPLPLRPFEGLQTNASDCSLARLHLNFSQGEAGFELMTDKAEFFRLAESCLKALGGWAQAPNTGARMTSGNAHDDVRRPSGVDSPWSEVLSAAREWAHTSVSAPRNISN